MNDLFRIAFVCTLNGTFPKNATTNVKSEDGTVICSFSLHIQKATHHVKWKVPLCQISQSQPDRFQVDLICYGFYIFPYHLCLWVKTAAACNTDQHLTAGVQVTAETGSMAFCHRNPENKDEKQTIFLPTYINSAINLIARAEKYEIWLKMDQNQFKPSQAEATTINYRQWKTKVDMQRTATEANFWKMVLKALNVALSTY